MEKDEIIAALSPEQTDEGEKLKLLKDVFPKEEKPPEENIIQAVMRIIRKPTIPEASEGVYDAAVEYLKGISRY